MSKPSQLTEWEYFVWRHQQASNLWFHFVSFSSSGAVILVSVFTGKYIWLLLLPATQYIGFLGHKVAKEGEVRNRDFVSIWTTIYLAKIFYLIALGRFSKELGRVKEKMEAI